MSVASWIDIRFISIAYSPLEALQLLLNGGWSANFGGEIVYLPLGDNESYDWKSLPISHTGEVLEEITRKVHSGEILGIQLVWNDSECGGDFLFHPDRKVSFSISINRRQIPCLERITDVGWYLDKLLLPFTRNGWEIESIIWSENY